MDYSRLIETVAAAQTGDQSALTRIYIEYVKPVYYLASKLTPNKESAEDATYKVFNNAFNSMRDLREPAFFRVWLNRITANICTNAIASDNALLIADIEENAASEFYEEYDTPPVPEEVLNNAQTIAMIVKTIDTLPISQRVCMYYYYYMHMAISQIAKNIDTNENAIKNSLALAVKKIGAECERLEKEEGVLLYGVTPSMLSSIFDNAFENYVLPQEVLTEVLDRVIAQLSADAAVEYMQSASDIESNTAPVSATVTNPSVGGTVEMGAVNADKAPTRSGLWRGTKITIIAASVVLVAGLLSTVMLIKGSWNSSSSANRITQEDFDRAVEENNALQKRLEEKAEQKSDTIGPIVVPLDTLDDEEQSDWEIISEYSLQEKPEKSLQDKPDDSILSMNGIGIGSGLDGVNEEFEDDDMPYYEDGILNDYNDFMPESAPQPAPQTQAPVFSEQWKQLYYQEMKDALAFSATHDFSTTNPVERYFIRLYGFMLADINFDGIPELIVIGDDNGRYWGLRIFTLYQNNTDMIFNDCCNPPGLAYCEDLPDFDWQLYRKISDGSYAYFFFFDWSTASDFGGEIYSTSRATKMNKQFEEDVKKAEYCVEDIREIEYDTSGAVINESYVPHYWFNDQEVSEVEYNRQMRNLISGYEKVARKPCILWIENPFNGTGADGTDNDLVKFLNSYVPEG